MSHQDPPAHESGLTSTPLVIVLIEDEAQIRRFLRATLTNQGYRCFEATTGAEGLVEASCRQPDLVLLDLGLPDLDGIEIIRRLREWTTVPIIVLSARDRTTRSPRSTRALTTTSRSRSAWPSFWLAFALLFGTRRGRPKLMPNRYSYTAPCASI